MNEVARALAFSTTALGLIPAGSGNGLARELNIPFDPAAALKKALQGTDYRIDAGEIGGHLFFNAAGMGFDAQVSALFNSRPHGRRGFLSYIILALQALLTYQPEEYTIVTEHETLRQPFLLIALANSRQYGNGAIVAPHAQLNDGQLDLVTIRARSPLILLWEARRLFNGTITKSASVQSRHIRHATISSPQPLCLHVDGEPVANMEATLSVDLHPAALCVRM
jgi:YegS/Rv2252/BmrU family lipid kinase